MKKKAKARLRHKRNVIQKKNHHMWSKYREERAARQVTHITQPHSESRAERVGDWFMETLLFGSPR
ncbi:MAG: hypothetical protein ACI9H6_000409 [Patiriisocius sp.]|jgi:hypothetical protein